MNLKTQWAQIQVILVNLIIDLILNIAETVWTLKMIHLIAFYSQVIKSSYKKEQNVSIIYDNKL